MEREQSQSPPLTPKQYYGNMPRDEQIKELRQQWNTICGAGEAFLEHIADSGDTFPQEQLYPRVWVALGNLAVNMLGFDAEAPFRDISSVTETLTDRLEVISGRSARQSDRELAGARG